MQRFHPGLFAVVSLLAVGCGKDSGGGSGEPAKSTGGEPAKSSEPAGACALLTQADATALFEKPAAAQQSASQTPDANLNQCLWSHDYPDNSSHLVQLITYEKDIAYSADPDSQPFQIGDKGNLKVGPGGVDISWVQKGKTYMLSYSTVGPSAPKGDSKAEQVKALAKKIESKL